MIAQLNAKLSCNRSIQQYGPLILICLVVVGSSLTYPFLSWDDDFNITANQWVLNCDFAKIWSQPYFGFYIPVTYSFWALLSQLSTEPQPLHFHLMNVLFH